VLFGDSVTDTGNVYRLTSHTVPPVPPYYQGRFSDGPNWVDQLADLDKSNYAYGGATTDNTVTSYSISGTFIIPEVRQQIGLYFNDTANSTISFEKTLYIIWAGVNDFIYNPSTPISSIVNSLINRVQDLLGMGPKNVLVFNILPAQAMPLMNRFNQTLLIMAITSLANSLLQTSIGSIQRNYPNAGGWVCDNSYHNRFRPC
jgi:phospholipase/lecithinase/hemolysin